LKIAINRFVKIAKKSKSTRKPLSVKILLSHGLEV
jgi:hypothetical protein